MSLSLSLFLWLAIGGYFLGKRRGKPWLYALLSVPISFMVYFAVLVATAKLV